MSVLACPSCRIPMTPFQAGKVALDRCTYCMGLWFDGGELEAVLGKPVAPVLTEGMKTIRACPPCQRPLSPAELGGLRVEVCTTCHGIFLDAGELVALNGGEAVRIQKELKPDEAKVREEVSSWLDSLGV